MRLTLAGFILLAISAAAFAQAEGEVESIGFEGYYRPNACLPMKLRLRPTIGTAANYKLMVLQEDMDGDRVFYSRPFTLNGNPEGGRVEEKVWVYFYPQSRLLRQAQTVQELTNVLRIFLCEEKSGKQLVQIPILPGTTMPRDLDIPGIWGTNRGNKLVLMVGTSQSRPIRDIYAKARGITEEVFFVQIAASELPESSMAYQAVDAIVWLNADPMALTDETAAALEDYVKDGGKLVICQSPATWQKMKEGRLSSMLPVEIQGVRDEVGLASLRKLANLPKPGGERDAESPPPAPWGALKLDPWRDTASKTLPVVTATPKAGAVVDMYQVDQPSLPYLARWMFGHGTVVWAAQDFGDPSVISTNAQTFLGAPLHRMGWNRIWDQTLGWRYDSVTEHMARLTEYADKYKVTYDDARSVTDLSRSMLSGMEAAGAAAAYVALAVLFFIGYWLLAGPGTYFALLAKKKSQYSWVAFGAVAVGATGLTMLVVKLVLRGPPELHHVTFVRVTPDGQAVAHSQFGLYIKSDGRHEIALKEFADKRLSYIVPFPAHPEHSRDIAQFAGYFEYEVPMRQRSSTLSPTIEVPYRSTLKKFQSRWIGKFAESIEGKARLGDSGLAGRLINNTGRDLHSVYLIYTPQPGNNDDWLIHLPDDPPGVAAWPQGKIIDLALFTQARMALPGKIKARDELGFRGLLNATWMSTDVWGASFRGHLGENTAFDDSEHSAVLMSIYDRLAPPRGQRSESYNNNRFELLRRGGRQLDASAAVACGQFLIIARADGPLPFPIEVEGDRVEGVGSTYYQFIVPIERSGAATQPANLEQQEPPPPPEPAPAPPNRLPLPLGPRTPRR